MILRQYREFVMGKKWQTRRAVKPGEELVTKRFGSVDVRAVVANGRLKYREGRDYAVVPKRGEPRLFYYPASGVPIPADRRTFSTDTLSGGTRHIDWIRNRNPEDWMDAFKRLGWLEVRAHIDGIWLEHLQDISELDAKAEGVDSIDAYFDLWCTINKHAPYRLMDNPLVWVYRIQPVFIGPNKYSERNPLKMKMSIKGLSIEVEGETDDD